jgi:TonB family protein
VVNGSLRHVAILAMAFSVLAFLPAAASAQDALTRARGFYESADYEGALNLLETLKGTAANTEAAAYRVFCLVALGRRDEAKAAVEALVRVDPLFRPSEGAISPRLRSFFEDVRKPLLPEVVRSQYASAKAAFETKNWASAVAGFDKVMALLGEIGDADQGVADLRTLAMGFRDLARTASQPAPTPTPTPEPTPAPKPATPPPPAEPSVYGIEHENVKRPVAITKPMPEWRPESAVEERQNFTGAIEVVISEQGKVLSVRMIDSVHPRYDAQLIKAAGSWTFRPATKNGVAVKYRYAIAIQLGK